MTISILFSLAVAATPQAQDHPVGKLTLHKPELCRTVDKAAPANAEKPGKDASRPETGDRAADKQAPKRCTTGRLKVPKPR